MKERFLLVFVVLALVSGAAWAQAGYISGVPDANQPPGNPMVVGGFVTSNYCAPFAAVNITEYWDAQGAAGPADDVDGNPNLGVANTAQYIGWWMNTNDDPAMNGCPYRMNGNPNSKKGTLLTDIGPGLIQFARWDANNTFGCGPNLLGGKKGYPWTVSINKNLPTAWNEIMTEIDGAIDLGQPPCPLIVVWNFWNPQNPFYNSEDTYTYYDWGPLTNVSADPPEDWNPSQELGHAVTALGYKINYSPPNSGKAATNWVIVHDNWPCTGTAGTGDMAIPFAHNDGQTLVWMANVTVDPSVAPAVGTLTVSKGAADPGNHNGCIGGAVTMAQINFAADNTEEILLNALKLDATVGGVGGTGNDANDIASIDLVKDNDNDGAPDDGETVLASCNGGYDVDNGTVKIVIPGDWASKVAKNGSINVLVVYHLQAGIPQGNTYKMQVSAVYATGLTSYLPATIAKNPDPPAPPPYYSSGTMTSDDCITLVAYPVYPIGMWKLMDDGRRLVVYATSPGPMSKPKVTGGGGGGGVGTFGSKIYIQDPFVGGSGIAIDFLPGGPPPLQVGQELSQIEGTIYTYLGEKRLIMPQVQPFSTLLDPIKPVAMNNGAVGGGDWHYNSVTQAGQKGVEGGVGLNNIGRVVRTCGMVTELGPTYFYVDDGSPPTGPGPRGIKVKFPTEVSPPIHPPFPGQYACVTGVSSTEMVDGRLQRVILIRNQSDLWPDSTP